MTADVTAPPEDVSSKKGLPLRWWPQVTALLLVIVELSWIVPWYRMVIQISYMAPVWEVFLVLGGVMLAGYLPAYVMEAVRLLRGIQLGGLAVMLGLSLVVAEQLLLHNPLGKVMSGLFNLDPGSVVLVLFVCWLWWRGVSLARAAIRPMTAWRRFELGLLLFMAFIFIANHLRRQSPSSGFQEPGLGWYVFFLFTGFLSVIFARVSYVGLAKGVRKNPFDRRWLASTTGILAACIAVAAMLGSLLTGQYRMLLDWLEEGIRLLIAVLIFIAAIPAFLVARLLEPLIPWLRQLMAARPTPVPAETPSPGGPLFPQQLANQVKPIPLSLQSIIFWGLVLLVVLALLVRARRRAGILGAGLQDEPESLLKRGEARKLLRKALQEAMGGLAAALRPIRRAVVAARIRRIYALLLELCAQLGRPRLPSKTPLEYLPEMGELFSALIADLELITQAYVRVRYGEIPETAGEIEAVEAAWKRINEEGQQLKRAGQGKLKTVEVQSVEKPGV